MNCPKCQTEVAVGALFCGRCGAQILEQGERPSLGGLPTQRPVTGARRFKPGDVLLRRYRVTGELGQGGMGIVYKCSDEVGGIEIALKALPPELSHNTVEMEEVRENFRLVERLHHPNIAAVKTLENDSDTGDYYLILELVEGVDLRRWRKQQGGHASLDEVLPILRQVAAALDYAHSQKIIHRDIKPSNVMVSPDGTVKVLDFGLAAQIQSSLSRVSQVHYGTSGTGPYMAPEQWRGHRQDGGTDQYALAVVVYELLAGHLPFEGHEVTILREAVLRDAPVQIEELRAKVWSALARGLAKDRTQRYHICEEFVYALANGETQSDAGAEEPSAASLPLRPGSAGEERKRPLTLRTPKMLTIGLVGMLVLGFVAWQWVWKPMQARVKVEAEAYTALAGNQTEAALQLFLANFPDGRHAPEARAEHAKLVAERKLLESERAAKAKAEADAYAALGGHTNESALQNFLNAFPDSQHAPQVRENYEKLRDERQLQEAEREAKIKAEAEAYAALAVNKTEGALERFLDAFPDSRHVAEVKKDYDELVADREHQEADRAARLKAEDDAYAALSGNRTEADLQDFLTRFPDGAHARAARTEWQGLVADRQRQEAAQRAAITAAADQRRRAAEEQQRNQQARDAEMAKETKIRLQWKGGLRVALDYGGGLQLELSVAVDDKQVGGRWKVGSHLDLSVPATPGFHKVTLNYHKRGLERLAARDEYMVQQVNVELGKTFEVDLNAMTNLEQHAVQN